MSTIFFLLFFISFICLVVGLISPHIFSRNIRGVTRKKISLIFGGALIASLFFIGLFDYSAGLTEIKDPLQEGSEKESVLEIETKTPSFNISDTDEEIKVETPDREVLKTNPQTTPDYYINVDGNKIQSPTYYPSVPAGASALCRDGTYSFSQNRRGTCSHHGGVAQWLR